MAILEGDVTIIESEEDVVYSEDPGVSVPDKLKGCGWVSASEATVMPGKKGGDVVTERALGPAERSKYRNIAQSEGQASAFHFVALTAVIKVGKIRKPSEVRKWVNAVAQRAPMALDLLALRVLARTNGSDPTELYPFCRSKLGYETEPTPVEDDAEPGKGSAPAEEGDPDEGASKS